MGVCSGGGAVVVEEGGQSSLWMLLLSKCSIGVSSNGEAQATMPNVNATRRESEDLTIFGLVGMCV